MATRWTQEEDEYLLSNYGQYDASFLSEVLSRTPVAIEKRLKRLHEQERDAPPTELEYFLARSQRMNPKKIRKKRDR